MYTYTGYVNTGRKTHYLYKKR